MANCNGELDIGQNEVKKEESCPLGNLKSSKAPTHEVDPENSFSCTSFYFPLSERLVSADTLDDGEHSKEDPCEENLENVPTLPHCGGEICKACYSQEFEGDISKEMGALRSSEMVCHKFRSYIFKIPTKFLYRSWKEK